MAKLIRILKLNHFTDEAFGIFRICFYLLLLFYFYKFNSLEFGSWLRSDMKVFYQPISFFKYFKFEDLILLNDKIIKIVWFFSMLFCAVGFLFPLSSLTCFLSLLLLVGIPLNFGKVSHASHLPLVLMGIMAFNFSSGSFSLDSFLKSKKANVKIDKMSWTILNCRIYMSLVYFAAGYEKLHASGLAWIFSENLSVSIITNSNVTAFGLFVGKYLLLTKTIAFFTVLFQITAPISLFSSRYAKVCLTSLFIFHIGTYLTIGVNGAFWGHMVCFIIWLPWLEIENKFQRFKAFVL